ncbi:kinase-like domain-containing protein [Mycena alexandri]|uniref:Kinase-like domain-containing protein n=1 Tax=Mycena alexandri TaxID=1745969 RepID=A0AAD6SE42_9AGAR|nr:kinase-like domain-containing protein [Mycena alexandri]
MAFELYDFFLTSIILLSWYFTLWNLYAMIYEQPCNAENLMKHCSQYAIPKADILNVETQNSGNALIVSSAEYLGQLVVVKQWVGGVGIPHVSRVLFTKRLIRDLDRWRALEHPNIAPILGVALHLSNFPALVVPFHRTARDLLTESPDADVLNLLQGVVAGLSYLHGQNPPITHGDLKGSTVFVSPAGRALLSDIGIPAIPQPPDWGFHGVDDARWLAPEIMDPALRPSVAGSGENSARTPNSHLPVTPESDIYSFGMLAYEMYTRARPFASTAWAAAVVVRVVTGKRPRRPSKDQSPQLSSEMWDLIQLCWAQNYRDRPHIHVLVAWLEVFTGMRAVECIPFSLS